MPTKEELLQGFTIGEWEILPGQGIFRRGDREVRPEPLIFKVLYSLAMPLDHLTDAFGRRLVRTVLWPRRPILQASQAFFTISAQPLVGGTEADTHSLSGFGGTQAFLKYSSYQKGSTVRR